MGALIGMGKAMWIPHRFTQGEEQPHTVHQSCRCPGNRFQGRQLPLPTASSVPHSSKISRRLSQNSP